MDPGHVDLQDAATQLGVHYQTAYKWVRSGALPAVLVQGRYLLDREVVTQFAEQRTQPRSPRPRRPRGGIDALADRMFDHLVAGDEHKARQVVSGLVGDGVALATVVQQVLVPALSRIGTGWQAGRLTISDEHQASAIVERMMGGHLPNPRGRRRGTAVVAALADDRHALPTSMAAAALREDNWHVHHLGADVPTDELVRFCRDTPVDLAVITVTNASVGDAADHTAARLEAQGVCTLVGRPGSTLDELQRRARRRRSRSG